MKNTPTKTQLRNQIQQLRRDLLPAHASHASVKLTKRLTRFFLLSLLKVSQFITLFKTKFL